MIVVLGASGYIGQEFVRELAEQGETFRALSRKEVDYSNFDTLLAFLKSARPAFVVNAAGYTGKPNVDACEIAQADTLAGNTLLPQTIAQACSAAGVAWGHVSSGCIYSGAKIATSKGISVEKDMTKPEMRRRVAEEPDSILGFTEKDRPNFTFRDPPCSFYSGTKALGEEAILGVGNSYIWRLRIPFDEQDNPRNYLTKIQRYSKVYDNVNSISHRQDFVRACLNLWRIRAPFGIYNVTNPGFVTTRQVVEMLENKLRLNRKFEFWASDEEFYRVAAKTPRSNCVMDTAKLLGAGVRIRTVIEALDDSLHRWTWARGQA
jgi:dTDP-4-dehydrorhamnose reductase